MRQRSVFLKFKCRFLMFMGGALLLLNSDGVASAQDVTHTVEMRNGVVVTNNTTVTPSQPRAVSARPLRTLKEALDILAWDSNRRGPLLAIAPENVNAWTPRDESDAIYTFGGSVADPLIAPAQGGVRPEIAAPYFGRKLIRCGSMTVLAPMEMVLLNTALPRQPDPTIGLDRGEKMRLLEATLTPGEWQQLGSEAGLGADDMSSEQKAIFLSLLPNPFRLIKIKTVQLGQFDGFQPDLSNGADPNTVLSEDQRESVRLRLNRTTRMMLISTAARQDPIYDTPINLPDTAKMARWDINVKDSRYGNNASFGIKMRDYVPSRLKSGQIDFDAQALDAYVAIGEAKTVGEVVAAAKQATGLELYCDERAAKLTIWWNGGTSSVRTGDLLKALCWAVTGVFRKVGPDFNGHSAYVLTDDIEGIGTRRTRIQAWWEAGQALKQKLQTEANKKIAASKPLTNLSFAANDPFTISPGVAQKVEANWATSKGRYTGTTIPLSELTAAQREQVQSAFARHEQLLNNNPSLRETSGAYADRVNVSVQTKLTYLVPEIGEVPSNDVPPDNINAMLPPAEKSGYEEPPGSQPDTWKPTADPVTLPDLLRLGNSLCVAPASPEEAAEIVDSAHSRGITSVWLQIQNPELPAGRALMEAAVKEAKPWKITIYAVVRLMMSGGGDVPPDISDINILGETGSQAAARRMIAPETYPGANESFRGMTDWLNPGAPGTEAYLRQRLKDIAGTPGLAGIVLKMPVVAGYTLSASDTRYVFYGIAANDYGYTPANRLALMRKTGCDPIDLSENSFGAGNSLLPHFTTNTNPYAEMGGYEPPMVTVLKVWNGIRYDEQMSLLQTVYRNFRADFPALTVLLANPEFGAVNSGWGTARWTAPDTLPDFNIKDGSAPQAAHNDLSTSNAGKASGPIVKWERPQDRLWTIDISPLQMKWLVDTPQPNYPVVETDSPRAFSLLLRVYLRYLFSPVKTLPSGVHPDRDGVILDLSGFPIDKVTRFIEEGIAR